MAAITDILIIRETRAGDSKELERFVLVCKVIPLGHSWIEDTMYCLASLLACIRGGHHVPLKLVEQANRIPTDGVLKWVVEGNLRGWLPITLYFI